MDDNKVLKKFYILVIFLYALIWFLNRNSTLMEGILPYYLDFKNIIQNGFDPSYASHGRPTFPMWGYGWIFLITEKKPLIFLAQGLISIISLYLLCEYTIRNILQTKIAKYTFLLLILLSTSWIAIQFTLSPYGLAISLLILSLLLFSKLLNAQGLRSIFFLLAGGILAGLLLNFRSDYLYFIIAMPVFFLFQKNLTLYRKAGNILIWFFILGLFLLPWAMYTYKVVGKPLLASTNTGHVLYIGLGNLPNNKWGVLAADHDAVMREDLKRRFGEPADSLTYDGDMYLKDRFKDLVISDPMEYLYKVIYSAKATLFSGIYVPEFFNLLNNCSHRELDQKLIDSCKDEFVYTISHRPLMALFDSYNKFFVYGISYISIGCAAILLFLSFCSLPAALIFGLREKSFFILLCAFACFYQFLINILAFQMKLYSTNTYILGIVLIAFVVDRCVNQKRIILR